MASFVTVEWMNKRHKVSTTPMMPLSSVLASACEAMKLDASSASLFFGKDALDLSSPLRFANLPSKATLTLVVNASFSPSSSGSSSLSSPSSSSSSSAAAAAAVAAVAAVAATAHAAASSSNDVGTFSTASTPTSTAAASVVSSIPSPNPSEPPMEGTTIPSGHSDVRVSSDKVVVVALQLPNFERLQGMFSLSMSLWALLKNWELQRFGAGSQAKYYNLTRLVAPPEHLGGRAPQVIASAGGGGGGGGGGSGEKGETGGLLTTSSTSISPSCSSSETPVYLSPIITTSSGVSYEGVETLLRTSLSQVGGGGRVLLFLSYVPTTIVDTMTHMRLLEGLEGGESAGTRSPSLRSPLVAPSLELFPYLEGRQGRESAHTTTTTTTTVALSSFGTTPLKAAAPSSTTTTTTTTTTSTAAAAATSVGESRKGKGDSSLSTTTTTPAAGVTAPSASLQSPQAANTSNAPVFDPYKPLFMSTAAQPPRFKSEETPLSELEVLPIEREIVFYGPSTQVFDPSRFEVPDDFYNVVASDFAPSVLGKADGSGSSSSGGGGVGGSGRTTGGSSGTGDVSGAASESQLVTKSLREKQKQKAASKYRKCLIRVRFPDQTQVQATFRPMEKIEELYAVVRSVLLDPQSTFTLYVAPPKQELDPNTRIFEMELYPAAIVNFSSADKVGPFLNMELAPALSLDGLVNGVSGFPVDEKLLAQQKKDAEERALRRLMPGIGGGAGGGAGTSSSSTSKTPSKKPAWMK